MKLIGLELYDAFRGLQAGFKIDFNRPVHSTNLVEPVCLVGMNGSGKSNLMQTLAEIFHFLECFVLPETVTEEYLLPELPFGFRLHYQLPVTNRNYLENIDSPDNLRTLTWRGVIITRKKDEDPVFEYYYDDIEDKQVFYDSNWEDELIPGETENSEKKDDKPTPQDNKTDAARLLPNQVIGYSSGMNEMISNPFIRMDFFYLDQLKAKTNWNNSLSDPGEEAGNSNIAKQRKQTKVRTRRVDPELTVNRLFFLDYHSNMLMMLANFLIKESGPTENELNVIKEVVGIEDLHSFRVVMNKRVKKEISTDSLLTLVGPDRVSDEEIDIKDYIEDMDLPAELNRTLLLLEECSTTSKITRGKRLEGNDTMDKELKIELYFKVDGEMKRAFREKFPGGAVTLFRGLYLLNLLNFENYDKDTKYVIKSSDIGVNISAKLPKVASRDKVFLVDEVRLRKKNGKRLLYKQLSDGEHQYMQVAGSLMLINDSASLFLMDEPETHFNPEWRSKLISSLNRIRTIQLENDTGYNRNITDPVEKRKHQESLLPVQDILLTTHSPFVVSDCQAENVYIFERDKVKGVQVRKPGMNTYGTSSHILLDELFKRGETIANVSKAEIDGFENEIEQATNHEQLEEIKKKAAHLGDSVEKFMMYYKLNTKQTQLSGPGDDDDLMQTGHTNEEPVPA